ncbi:MAG: DUF4168 domain-containing protein [Spirulina sp.]
MSTSLSITIAQWGRSLLVSSLLASATLMASTVPLSFPGTGMISSVHWGAAAWAQDINVSPEEIMGYARSVLEMEGPRTEAYNDIQALLAGTNVNINSISLRCTATNSLNQLPRNLRNDVRTIVVNYCNQASQIVQANGLRNERFDAITAAYPQDATLAEQIRAALMQIQQQSQSSPASDESP